MDNTPNKTEEEPKIPQKAPYVIDVEAGTYVWCACGQSAAQPYCDGTHKDTCFAPIIETITENKRIAWCGCKRSKNKPYCDGTHTKL